MNRDPFPIVIFLSHKWTLPLAIYFYENDNGIKMEGFEIYE